MIIGASGQGGGDHSIQLASGLTLGILEELKMLTFEDIQGNGRNGRFRAFFSDDGHIWGILHGPKQAHKAVISHDEEARLLVLRLPFGSTPADWQRRVIPAMRLLSQASFGRLEIDEEEQLVWLSLTSVCLREEDIRPVVDVLAEEMAKLLAPLQVILDV